MTEKYSFTEKRLHNEFRVLYGENEFYFWDNMFLDYYIGVGIDFYSRERVKIEQDISNPMSPSNIYTLESENLIAPRFYLGVKYGITF